jgi:hypothetical protein
VRRDEVRRPRVHARSMSTRAASELLPGPLGVPARSWLTTAARSSDRRQNRKARPDAEQTLRLARREAPACSGNGTRTIGFALFGPPSPLYLAGPPGEELGAGNHRLSRVMPGLVPGIQYGGAATSERGSVGSHDWIAGTSPAMTRKEQGARMSSPSARNKLPLSPCGRARAPSALK